MNCEDANARNTVRCMRKRCLLMDEYINREALRDLVESIDWYSVRRGELITGAESSENALYKANDIYSAIDKIGRASCRERV